MCGLGVVSFAWVTVLASIAFGFVLLMYSSL